MEKKRLLVVNAPRVYREVIVRALKRLRPCIEVSAAEPEELEREVAWLRPHLIICSGLDEEAMARGEGRSSCWVVLYPDGEDRAEVYEAGAEGRHTVRVLHGVQVDELLSVVDETELRRSDARSSLCVSGADQEKDLAF